MRSAAVRTGSPGDAAGGWRDEAALVAAWFAATPRHLLLADGRLAAVVFRGHPGHGPGPDIRSAILALPDGRLLQGDIEAHLTLADWDRHGHAGDPRYAGVILHLLGDPPPRPVHDGIPAAAWAPPEGRPLSLPIPESPLLPCHHGPAAADPDAWLDTAASTRCRDRAAGLAARIADHGESQAAWHALLALLGAGPDRGRWEALAEEFPAAALPSLARSHPTAVPDPAHLAVRLLARLDSAAWRGHPAGHPRYRVRAAACLGLRLDLVLAMPLDRTTPGALADLAGPGLGRDRAAQLAASVLLPLAVARDPAPVPDPAAILRDWPLHRPAGVVRRLAARLGTTGKPLPVRSTRDEQALLWQRDHGCRRDACWNCPLA